MDCFGLKRFLSRNCCFCGSDDNSSTDEVQITKISKISATGSVHSVLAQTENSHGNIKRIYTNGKDNTAYTTDESDYAQSVTYTNSLDAYQNGADNLGYSKNEEDDSENFESTTSKSEIVQEQPKLLPDVPFDRQISGISNFTLGANEKGLTEMVMEEIEKSFSQDVASDQNTGEQQNISSFETIDYDENEVTTDGSTWRNRLIDDLNEDIEFEDISSEEDENNDQTISKEGEFSLTSDKTMKVPSLSPNVPGNLSLNKVIKCEGQPVVIDVGSYEIKAGFAGDYIPSHTFRTVIGNWGAHLGEGFQSKLDDTFFGVEALSKHTMITRRHPIQDGDVTDWKDFEKVMDYTISKLLEIDAKDHPILITEPSTINTRQRERKVEILMESLHCRMMQLKKQSVLSSISSGKDICLVVSSGHGYTEVVPVYYGYAIDHAIQRMKVGGRHVTDYLCRLILENRGVNFISAADQMILEKIKYKYAQVLPYESFEEKHWNKQIPYELPDGEILQLGGELHRCTEPIFSPELIGKEELGVDKLIKESIKRVDPDISKVMEKSILLAGGNCSLRGFREQLMNKLAGETPGQQTENTSWGVTSCDNLTDSAWLGGSLHATSDSFSQTLITDDDYFEYGPSIIHRLCL